MIYQPSLEENLKGNGRARNTDLILMPDRSSRSRRLRNHDLGGPGKRPDFINLVKEGVLLEAEPHIVHHNELLPEKLSEELILEPMKVSKIATAELAVQRDIYQ